MSCEYVVFFAKFGRQVSFSYIFFGTVVGFYVNDTRPKRLIIIICIHFCARARIFSTAQYQLVFVIVRVPVPLYRYSMWDVRRPIPREIQIFEFMHALSLTAAADDGARCATGHKEGVVSYAQYFTPSERKLRHSHLFLSLLRNLLVLTSEGTATAEHGCCAWISPDYIDSWWNNDIQVLPQVNSVWIRLHNRVLIMMARMERATTAVNIWIIDRSIIKPRHRYNLATKEGMTHLAVLASAWAAERILLIMSYSQ